jgi:WXG100 family type VII secretion target
MTIRVNYDNVFRQAAKMQSLAEEHRRAAEVLDAERARLAAAWRDPAGAAYAAAAVKLVADMRASADELVRLGAQIRDAAVKFKAQEEANAKAARGLAN